MKLLFRCYLFLFAGSLVVYSQTAPPKPLDVYVDKEGTLRWSSSNDEVSLFGVNYTLPFAYSYRAHKKLGLSCKESIDLDVEQMARLGFDAYRVHVWDREISDTSGNLLKNEHLDLFDYLLAKLAEYNIKSIITPIAWWGNGYPESDEMTPGFSQRYPRIELITNPNARKAERKYLEQFITHINRYRKVSYKDDPFIVGVEIINEPTHPNNGAEVTDYINDMANVLRGAGCTKPLFYNITISWDDVQANAVTNAEIGGISFQWYPTGLVHGKMLTGNYLVNVNSYSIPSNNVVRFKQRAKMVYEFDAADIGGSYMYPAMIRSFREAGTQFATMFCYDPSQIAWSNTEYPTHFMNLLYTPSKALSLMIAGRAFHQLPRYKSFGNYPANNQFDEFSVDYNRDVSEMNADTEFIYSNSTSSTPKNDLLLQHIAGYGNSPIVRYDGTGAYFLDKLKSGLWQLEIYPDVLWLQDPFDLSENMSKQVARLFWNERHMKIDLVDIGNNFTVYPLSDMKQGNNKSFGSDQVIKPGKYLVAANNADDAAIRAYSSKKEKFLEGLYTPPSLAPGIYVVNKTSQYAKERDASAFRFQIAGERPVDAASLYIRRLDNWKKFEKCPLTCIAGFEYVVADSPRILQPGILEYYVDVKSAGKDYAFPAGTQHAPGKVEFTKNNYWSAKFFDDNESILLFDVLRDRKDLVFPFYYDRSQIYSIDYKNGSTSDETSLALDVSFSKSCTIPFGVQLNVSPYVKPFRKQLAMYKSVVIKARSTQDSLCTIGLNLLMDDGKCYGIDIHLNKSWSDVDIPLTEFSRRMSLILPNPYPSFFPKMWQGSNDSIKTIPKLCSLEGIQITIDPADISKNKNENKESFEIVSIAAKK